MAESEKISDKRQALLQATLELVSNHGFHKTPMAKIAKIAGVSAGTIYLYFDNKQDLIDSLYLEMKASFTDAAFKDYNPDKSVKEGFAQIWKNMAAYKMNHVQEALFLAQCDNAPMISDKVREKGLQHLQPLLNLCERGRHEGILRDVSPYLLYAYTIYPISFFAAVKNRDEFDLSKDMYQHTFDMAWNAIKAI
jgi:AcrR family transcriptional regulator